MVGADQFNRFLERFPHPHKNFFERPHLTRRRFFEIVGAGVTGSYLVGKLKAQEIRTQPGVATQNRAKNVIFLLLTGAPSHVDTFDLKVTNGVTPANFNPATISGIRWPAGLLPKIGEQLPNLAIVRSVRAWALVHSLAQTWTQIGRNPAAALGDIAPNIGSVVALERTEPGKIFPAFLALNAPAAVSSGYFPATYAPFKIAPSMAGIPDTSNVFGQPRFEVMYDHLKTLDNPLRVNSPLGKPLDDYDKFYAAAKGLMYNPVVNQAFSFTAADSARYGNTAFGNACLVAKQVLAANQGTHFVQINFGSWDMHQDIYGKANPRGNNLYTMGKPLDDAYSALISDLKSSSLWDNTLVVMMGEFGRTVGALSAAGGRDHYVNQFAVFAGAGVRGGKTIGATNDEGSAVADFGWSRNREVRPEDIEATLYSALGINWTTVRYDDPFGRGFEYVPFSDQDLYGPVNELWG
jgi:Protein of unknown function (DUF1501)